VIEIETQVDARDLAKLARQFHAEDALKDGAAAAGKYVMGVLAEYAPSSEANRPGRKTIVRRNGTPREVPQGYYERGAGWWYPVKLGRTFGEKHLKSEGVQLPKGKAQRQSFASLGIAGYKLRRTSETLGRRWTTRATDEGLTVVIGNNASYARYVHDARFQWRLHGLRGWRTAQRVLEDEQEHVLEIVGDFVQAKIEGKQQPKQA
jgi:hypothetical protein